MPAAAGALSGYLVAAHLYQCAIVLVACDRLPRPDAALPLAVSETARQALRAERMVLEYLFASLGADPACLDGLEAGLEGDSLALSAQAVATVVGTVGRALQLESFGGFQRMPADDSHPDV